MLFTSLWHSTERLQQIFFYGLSKNARGRSHSFCSGYIWWAVFLYQEFVSVSTVCVPGWVLFIVVTRKQNIGLWRLNERHTSMNSHTAKSKSHIQRWRNETTVLTYLVRAEWPQKPTLHCSPDLSQAKCSNQCVFSFKQIPVPVEYERESYSRASATMLLLFMVLRWNMSDCTPLLSTCRV